MTVYTSYIADEHEQKTYTAWELGADWWWTTEYFVATKRAVYSEVNIGPNEGVRLSKLQTGSLHMIVRYVSPETPMRLVRMDHV